MVTHRPSQTTQRHSKPTGYIVTHQLVRQVRQVRHKRHAPATCTPPLPSSKQSITPSVTLPVAYPCGLLYPVSGAYESYESYESYEGAPMSNNHPDGNSSPEPNHTAACKPTGYIVAHPSCQTGQTGQTGQTQASRPRNTHTAVAIKLPCIPLR